MLAPIEAIKKLRAVLRAQGVPHALIGGWAVAAWGFLRGSDDIDLLIDLPGDKRTRLLEALSPGYEARWVQGDEDDPLPGLVRGEAKDGGLPFDMIPVRSAADRRALERAVEVELEGETLPILAPEDLIAMKLEAGGGQDYEDARRLLAILAGTIDRNRLDQSCAERRVADRLRSISAPERE